MYHVFVELSKYPSKEYATARWSEPTVTLYLESQILILRHLCPKLFLKERGRHYWKLSRLLQNPFKLTLVKIRAEKKIGPKKEKENDKSESTSPVCQKTNIWGSVQVVT